MVQKGQQAFPVYDIGSLQQQGRIQDELMAVPFAAYLEVHPNLHFPHRHSFYHIVLFTEGCGSHTIDFERFPVHPGQVYFMIPGQVHSWDFEGTVDGYVINFSGDLFRSFLADQHYTDQFRFFRGNAAESVLQLPAQALGVAIRLVKQIIRELQAQELLGKDMASAALISFLITALRAGPSRNGSAAPDQNQLLLYNFRKLVEQYYTEKHLPKEYAAMLYITPNHLNGLCRELLNKPAGSVIRDRILLEAKRLLVNRDLSIAEIGFRLNFSDNSYFTKFFKKYTGITPDEFRRSFPGKAPNQ